jgi:hypothetical protein
MSTPTDVLMLSLPCSGTSWLTDLILAGNPHLRSQREFFNPAHNQRDKHVLCEALAPCDGDYSHAAVCWEAQAEALRRVYESTWKRSACTFTRENHLAFKVGFFQQHFQAFILYRHRTLTFPSSSKRPQALEWYRGLYDAFVKQRADDDRFREAIGFCVGSVDDDFKKACAAHIVYFGQLLHDGKRHGVPMIDYEYLMSERDTAAMTEYLAARLPPSVGTHGLSESIVNTADRRCLSRPRAFTALGADRFCKRLVDILAETARWDADSLR